MTTVAIWAWGLRQSPATACSRTACCLRGSDLKPTLDWRREQPLRGQIRVLIHDHGSGALRATGAGWATELLHHGATLGPPDGRYRLSMSCGGEPLPVFFTPGGDDSAHFTVD